MMERKAGLLSVVAAIAENEKVAIKYAEHLEQLFDVIIPERIGEAFGQALKEENYEEAVSLCAAYYRKKPDNRVEELSGTGAYDVAEAEKTIHGIMREVNIDWTFPDGEIDFLFDPTERKGPRNHEWLWQFNRHNYWNNLVKTYTGTGDERYAAAFEKQLLQWIAQTEAPSNWNGPGSAWRTIECGLRLLGSWQAAFDGFKKAKSVSDVALLLMIASMYRQSMHLVKHPTQGNWLMMESNGVYTFSALFTELADSQCNRKIAAERLLEELEAQILPDGMHNELSPDYQSVVFTCASNFYGLAVSLGMEKEVPDAFVALIEKTVHAAVLLSTPAFTQPRTNDTYTIPTTRFTERAANLLGKKPAYEFVNSGRSQGQPPEGETASAYLPYAGFAVMRTDWSKEAAYLCFDVGPLGRAHMHQDKLNINLYKGDEELLYDDGGGQYEISRARDYGISGYGHNTVLVDGMAQCRRLPLEAEAPIDAGWITNDRFDYAIATYEDTFGEDGAKPAIHTREVRFCKPGFFCVSDILTSADGNAHEYEILFHLDTTKVKALSAYQNGMISEYGRKYELAIIPLDEETCKPTLKTVSAQTEPYQGWYNGRNEGNLHEAITVSRVVSGVKDYRYTTLLFPMTADRKLPEVTKGSDGRVRVVFEGKEYQLDLDALNQ